MATCYVTEWSGIREQAGGPQAPYGFQKTNNVTITTETDSAVFGPNTNLIEVSPDAVCSVLIGAAPDATTANMRIPADSVRFYSVTPGQKISVIANT